MKFELTTLGIASASPIVSRYPSAHVLNVHERLFLIDCGEGTQVLLKKYSISPYKINEIFISHVHGDHIFGLYGLLSSMSLKGRTLPITIFAPKQFASILSSFLKDFGNEINYEINHVIVSGQEPNVIYSNAKVEVFAFPLNHRIETYGYLFKEKEPSLNIDKEAIKAYNISHYEILRLKEGEDVIREDGETLISKLLTYKPYSPRSFAYCSDTAQFDKLSDWVKDVDLLYHEATFTQELSEMATNTLHSTALQAATLATKANVGKLVLGHFSSRYKDLSNFELEAKEIFKNAFLGFEGARFNIPLKK